jgi:hypothetical protein
MKIEPGCERYVRRLRFPEAGIGSLAVMCLLTFGPLDAKAMTWVNCAAATQEKPQNKQEQTAKDEKEPTTVIAGTVVNQRGLPVKGQTVELYMVVNGISRDAYGAPLRGAITVGPNRQILGMLMFPVKTETDATGRFSMELPRYMMVPSGVEMTGWTVVSIDASRNVSVLNSKGAMATIETKPRSNQVDLGKLTASPPPAAGP